MELYITPISRVINVTTYSPSYPFIFGHLEFLRAYRLQLAFITAGDGPETLDTMQEDAHLAGGWISVVRLDGCSTIRRILEETENQRTSVLRDKEWWF